MDGDMKKRKTMEDDHHREEEEDEDEDEDAKVEEFFALIRSTRDIRDRLIRGKAGSQLDAASKPSKREPKVWTPKFELEDFAEGSSGSRLPPQPASREAGPSKDDDIKEDNEQRKQQDNDGLDLKLSL